MKKIDVNLVTVKKNLEHMEDTYEEVFRRVNRLVASEANVHAMLGFIK